MKLDLITELKQLYPTTGVVMTIATATTLVVCTVCQSLWVPLVCILGTELIRLGCSIYMKCRIKAEDIKHDEEQEGG